MEGTRHEKIIIAVAAYVIGFSTAFIAFGVNQVNRSQEPYDTNAYVLPANEEPQIHHMKTAVSLAEEGLFAITQERKRILSANSNVLEASAIAALGNSGFHYAIIDAEVSPNGQFVYFCEQLIPEAQTCDAYIYGVEADALFEVSLEGERFQPMVIEHESVWNEGNLLFTDGAVSVSSEVPWVMTAAAGE